MSNDHSDNAGRSDERLQGSAAFNAAPGTVAPGGSLAPDNAESQAAGEQARADSDQATSAGAPGSESGQAGDVGAVKVGTSPDGDGTWDPQQDDPLDDGKFSDGERAGSTCVPRDRQGPAPAADSKATHLPTGSRSVEDIWGDDFDGVTPGHTLKGPRQRKPPAGCPGITAAGGAPPNLSVEGYDLLDVLGEGGVGVVYQAIQKSIERKIAVKMIKPGVGRDPEEKAKFTSEALVTGKLDHPNIVPIHDLGATADGQPFYTMKMVRGIPWGQVIRDKPLVENLRILLDVCDAVSFAHSKGVVHRDLKPDNIMLGEFGEVQLMDWGLGAVVSSDGNLADLSGEQAAGGTPAYMAPEMVTGEDGPVGIHSDIYLLGAVLHQIVTGKPPHGGARVLDSLENAINNVIQPIGRGGVLADIALHAMQTDPAHRYASVNHLKQALLDYQSHAESINLRQRSCEDLRRARENRDYEAFAQALFGFREALTLWEDNAEARAGVAEAQLQYARCAFEKGDLDLAASTLDPGCAAHRSLAGEIERAQRKRDVAKHRLKLFRATVMSLTVAVIVILTVASIWIYSAKRQAVAAKEEAVTAKEEAVASEEEALVAKEAAEAAREAEAEQRKRAEAARAKAQEEEARAVQALADLEQAYVDLVEAQEQEKRAWAQAKASELVAAETRDELARSGMLLDNSWWVFDGAAARQAQRDTAAALAMPVELTLTLADDVELALVLIPPGDFVMGSPPKEENRAADEYLHRVHHSAAFYLGKFELTETQWQAVTGQLPPSAADRDADPARPVSGVSYERIMRDLLPALQEHAPDGYEFRLPSEAEWEYACRAGTGTAYYAGDGVEALDSVGWFLGNSGRDVQPVGGKTPNAFGLYDTHGNVGETCADQYAPGFYLESPTEDPMAAHVGETPVVRGGSVLNTPKHSRAAYRSYVYSKNEYPFLGLRLALVPIRGASSSTEREPVGQAPDRP